ncbi:hypothetical protein L208DRAFT_1209879, partial [Tricholoma matsutake]
TEHNKSRPPMEKVIRHADGLMISTLEWSAIKVSARMIKNELWTLPLPTDPRAREQAQTKVYYKNWYPKEWSHAVWRLEGEHYLLTLCVSHWKVEH